MELEKLSETTLPAFAGKKIVCYTMVKDYLRQLQARFGLLDQVVSIADDLPQNSGNCVLDDGREVPVFLSKLLGETDWETHVLLITSEYYWIKYRLLETGFSKEALPETVYYFEDRDTAYYQHYLKQYEDTPLRELLVFRSGPRGISDFPDSDFTENAKALFDHLLRCHANDRYELVWIVGDPAAYPEYETVPNVRFVGDTWCVSSDPAEREAYYSAICLAKYFFFTEHASFVRFPREGQVRVQLWHGAGYKARSFYTSLRHECEYTIVTSPVILENHKREFDYTDAQLRITGLPKEDWLFHPAPREIFRKLCGVSGSKTIFWLPTFRSTGKGRIVDRDTIHSETELPVLNTWESLDRVNRLLEEKDCVLVIKPHPEQKQGPIMSRRWSRIVVIDNADLTEERLHVNQILPYADALISDYSSVTTDYSMLDRPIAFALEDLEEYREKRGFVFDRIEDWLPGGFLYTPEDFETFILDVADGKDPTKEKRSAVRSRMLTYFDDKSCERVLQAIGLEIK